MRVLFLSILAGSLGLSACAIMPDHAPNPQTINTFWRDLSGDQTPKRQEATLNADLAACEFATAQALASWHPDTHGLNRGQDIAARENFSQAYTTKRDDMILTCMRSKFWELVRAETR